MTTNLQINESINSTSNNVITSYNQNNIINTNNDNNNSESEYIDLDKEYENDVCCESFFLSCLFPCCWRRSTRQECSINLLTSKSYLIIYFLIIVITLVLLIYDLLNGNLINDLKNEPIWFIILDIFCITLMLFDIFIQFMAYKEYCKSPMNIFDSLIVLICIISIPIYFYIPTSDFIFTVIILLRFIAQLLRIVMIYKHNENRTQYVNTITSDVVDFTNFDDNNNGNESSQLIRDNSSRNNSQNGSINNRFNKNTFSINDNSNEGNMNINTI